MRLFSDLIMELDKTTKTNKKVAALAEYFSQARDADKMWVIALLSHRRPRRPVNTTILRTWAAEEADIPLWLFEESYHTVGDLAETITLLLEKNSDYRDAPLHVWLQEIIELKDKEEGDKKEYVLQSWRNLDEAGRFVFNKLITGSFRIGISRKLMTRALAQATGIKETRLSHSLMGNWSPAEREFHDLIETAEAGEDISRPYPFYLAYALDKEPQELGEVNHWLAEWKWDGIRSQLIIREGRRFLWTRGEELVTEIYPELEDVEHVFPDRIAIDGELLPWQNGRPLSFNQLQRRLGRKKVSKKLLKEVPVKLLAYDLLEYGGEDIREYPQLERRTLLEKLIREAEHPAVITSPPVEADNWRSLNAKRKKAREKYSEGLMLKHKKGTYKSGRKKGDWWKWKLDPLSVDGVLIYAQQGSGRRANLFTDYTFGVWNGDELIPFAKAYSGLSDAEFRKITNYVRRNTIERFGPVRSVNPAHVFEIAFEGIMESKRHKSGISVRFPRMVRWRKDKNIKEANTLQDLKQLLNVYGEN